MNTDISATPAATHLLASHHDIPDELKNTTGECCFCGDDGTGVATDDAINHKYFSDYNRMQADTGHVCAACAYCMDTRTLKQGHWIVTPDTFERVSTGDLLQRFHGVRDAEYNPPIAVHVSENPIRSEHAYHWTPISETTEPLTVSYGTQTLTVEWSAFDEILAAVEELRWHGFRGDDIRSGEPRLRNLESLGMERYQTLDQTIDPHRGTALLELVWTCSRAKDDQPEPPASA